MIKPSAVPAQIGFYLLLLFSFSVSVFPEFAYFLAGGAFGIWLLQILIFRRPSFASSRLFYPIFGLCAISLICLLLSKIFSFDNPTLCAGLYSVFYFVAMSFVPSQEKRKMITWTFLSGVILSLAIDVLSGLSSGGYHDIKSLMISEHLSVPVLIVFCLGLANYAASIGFREKIFYALILLPVGVGVMTIDTIITIVLLIMLLLISIVQDRSGLIVVGLIVVIVFSGLFGLKDRIKMGVESGEYIEIVKKPLRAIEQNADELVSAGFYGSLEQGPESEKSFIGSEPFFISLVKSSGPPSLLFLIWVIFESVRRDFAKIRKSARREEKAYHLATFLIIMVIIVVNIYESSFSCSPAILGLWMFLGMTEI